MKAVASIFFLIIFSGCGVKKDNSINREESLKNKTEGEFYPIDSALFEDPCKKEVADAITYRGTISYQIKDMAVAEKKMTQILEVIHAGDPETRNEEMQNGVLRKRFEYNIPAESFLALEKKLDSVLGRPVYKNINTNEISNEYLFENLAEEQQTYKICVARYNNTHTPFQEKNELLLQIKSS
ncbi:MAG: hypothetical protein ACTHJT_04930, partial [Cytophaga sp.]|uniref:hypothetical protein n=1 Tax=Cytophaga sp. TaxID=29535 RepID=UPI003F80284D